MTAGEDPAHSCYGSASSPFSVRVTYRTGRNGTLR